MTFVTTRSVQAIENPMVALPLRQSHYSLDYAKNMRG